jgi:twinkle protein
MVKDAELIFYNLNSLQGRKKAIIVEGEVDALSVYESGFSQNKNITHTQPDSEGETKEIEDPLNSYAVLSVPNGASGGNNKLDYLDNCSDYFLGLDEIIIATDGDAAGMALRDELIRRLGVERCRYVIYPKETVVDLGDGVKRAPKDMNEVLLHMGKDKVIDLVFSSVQVPVDGIYYVDDIFEAMFENFKSGVQIAPSCHMETWDEFFRWKKGTINGCTGYSNHGKTTFMLQLMLIKSMYAGWKWAIFSPENYPANDFYDDIIEMYVGKALQFMTQEEYVDAATFINDHFFYVYPDDDHDLLSIHEKFRYLILKKGCDGVLLDPWNQLDHNMGGYQREDMYLSKQLKDVKRFALLNHVVYNIIIHPKSPTYRDDRSLPVVDMYDLHGGAMWGNKLDGLLSYYRPDHHIDKSSTRCEIYVQKWKRKRDGGKPGMFEMNLVWSKRRYEDTLTGIIPCDPVRAKQFLEGGGESSPKENFSYTPIAMEGF